MLEDVQTMALELDDFRERPPPVYSPFLYQRLKNAGAKHVHLMTDLEEARSNLARVSFDQTDQRTTGQSGIT